MPAPKKQSVRFLQTSRIFVSLHDAKHTFYLFTPNYTCLYLIPPVYQFSLYVIVYSNTLLFISTPILCIMQYVGAFRIKFGFEQVLLF